MSDLNYSLDFELNDNNYLSNLFGVNDKNITNALIDIFDRREILYEKTANVQIDTDDKTIEDITFNLKEKLIIEEN